MSLIFACPPASEGGPHPGLSLAACRAAGCSHVECLRAAAARERLSPPVPAVGSARRLQALALLGYSTLALARRLGVAERVVRRVQRGKPAEVPAALAAAVEALYDALWDVRGLSPRSARMAARRGWCPPLAWDEPGDDAGHGIDDPAAVPAEWRRHRLTAAERLADVADVMPAVSTRQELAWRLGVTRQHLDTIVSRGRRAAGGAA